MRKWNNLVGSIAPILGMALTVPVFAQGTGNPTSSDAGNFARSMWNDQRHIFTSPARIHKKDTRWLVPLAGVTAFLIVTDERNMGERIHTDAQAIDRSLTLSNLGLGSLAAIPTFLAWQGWRNRNQYEAQTGWLAARAVADTLVVSEAVQLATRRGRPSATGTADFFSAGPANSAFPSRHAASAWALASVVSHRYPGWLTDLVAYGLASGVSVTRVLGREHSPSDVFVGSALGFLIGRYVAGTGPRMPERSHFFDSIGATLAHERASAGAPGSAYVPLDSWIYGALDRLAALGMIPSQTSGLRPWTRAECRRQVNEAQGLIGPARTAERSQSAALVNALLKELNEHDGAIALDSIYVRNGVIAGPLLNDSFHFGQTWTNDSGRPFGRGWNANAGFTAHAEAGRFFLFVNGEYQRAPGTPAYSPTVRQEIAGLDDNPLQPGAAFPGTSRFRPLDTYAGMRLGDFEFSAGKQTLWWGPTFDSPLSFSSNAEPTKNFRVSMIHPVHLPEILGHTVQMRGEFVIGKLGGQQYTWRPWFNAQKLTFKLTDNLEMGFTRWSIFWGVGHPITAGSLYDNFTSTSSPFGSAGVGRNDPGDRKGGFDFRYRIPGLRNWLTLYSDSYCDDDPSPLAAPRRAAINPGLYLTHIPGVANLDLRVEAPSTTPMQGDLGGAFFYYNDQYHSGNTNYGNLLGNAVGRDARAIEGWTSYWFTPRTRIQAGYRQLKGGTDFLPGGTTQSDATLTASTPLGHDWHADVTLQYERFWIPLLGGPGRNVSARLQLTWDPNLQLLKRTK